MSNIDTTTEHGIPEQQSDAQRQALFDAELAAAVNATISQAVQSRPEVMREPLISSASTPVAAVGDVDAAIGIESTSDVIAPTSTNTPRGPDGRFQKADPDAAAPVTAADPATSTPAATLPPPAPGAVPVAPAVPAVHPADAAPVVAETFTYVDNAGGSIELTRADIATLLAQRDWANNLPANVRDAFAAIASGEAVAIPRAEWARATGQQAPSLDNLTNDQQRYILELEQRAAAAQQAAAQSSPQFQQDYAAENARRAASDAASSQVAAEFKTKYTLTDDEERDLAQYVIGLGVIPSLLEQGRVYNPVTRQLLREADMRDVFQKALTIGMNSHPRLASRVIDAQVAARLSAELAANAAVEAKKGRASTISGTPSSALATPRSTTANLTRDETQRAIADLIAAGMNN